MKPISEMTTAELNKAMAVDVMKWNVLHDKVFWDKENRISGLLGQRWNPADNDNGYSNCYRAEEKMRELGLEEFYSEALGFLVEGAEWGGYATYDLIHATCKQRCRAMLQTVREANDD